MAKTSALDKLFNDTLRGFGLQTGRTASKSAINYVKNKLYNDSSKFRKLKNRFELPGKFPQAMSKTITLINVFREEYNGVDEPMLQRGMYLQADINFIKYQIEFMECLVENEAERLQLEKLNAIFLNNQKQITNG